ncbi:MAG: preprotein translocase subunit YajC [Pseudomonadota bacterium]
MPIFRVALLSTLLSMFGVTVAHAQAAGASPAGGIVDLLIPMALMFVVFYFLLIRPQQNAQKKHREMIAAVKRGDTVVTAGGLVGKVVKASDDPEVMVEIADGVQVKVMKATLTDVPSRTQPEEKKK